MKFLIETLFILTIQYKYILSQNYCYTLDSERSQKKHFADATSYVQVKGTDYGRQYAVPFCKPSKLWLLARHGTTLPDESIINGIEELRMLKSEVGAKNQQILTGRQRILHRDALCPEDLKLIRNWNLDRNITVDFANFLTIQGWNDMKSLAQSLKRIYPDLLSRGYSDNKFSFRYSPGQQNEASYKAFLDGLFGRDAHINITRNSHSFESSQIASFWMETYGKRTYFSEVENFKQSTMFYRTVSDISTKLGYQHPLSYKTIQLMWDVCRYEQAWFLDSLSAWCAPFNLADHEIMEYIQDLQAQYDAGYSSDFNSNIPCSAFQDLIKNFENSANPRITISFTHASALQLILVAMGAFKDDVLLTSTNYYTMKNRKWRTSNLIPFGANILAVQYECTGDSRDPVPKIKFFLNQNALKLPWCSSEICKLYELKSQFNTFCSAIRNSSCTIYRPDTKLLLLVGLISFYCMKFFRDFLA